MSTDFVPLHFPNLSAFSKPLRTILIGYGILLAIVAYRLVTASRRPKKHVAQLGNLTWKRNQFCRGWLITGDTGSGKTSSGINQLAHQVFQNDPKWGGLCIDEKGVYWETLSAMAYRCRRAIHDIAYSAIGQRQVKSADLEFAQPDDFSFC